MLHALIVDDESLARESLVYLLQEYCAETLTVVGAASSAAEVRKVLETNTVDTLFLDISMPLENGFELLASLPEGKYGVVFVTAYHQYALRAIKANAVDYLLKPVNIEELRAAIGKLRRIQQYTASDRLTYESSLQHTIEAIQTERKEVTRLTLPQQQGLSIVEVKDIVHLTADSNYTIFYLKDGKRIVVAKTLKEFEEVLDDAVFVRIHKSHIVNLDYLKSFSAMNSAVTTTVGTELAVSRRRWSEFTDKVANYSKKV